MGTRADFYVGRGLEAEWLGSIAWDGNPGEIPDAVKAASTEKDYWQAVVAFLSIRDDATKPEQGWPWPWNDSRTTDYAYAFDEGQVWASGFGRAWFDARHQQESDEYYNGQKDAVFPDMTSRKVVARGLRSGLIVLGL